MDLLDLSGLAARLSYNFVPVTPGAAVQFTVRLEQPLAKKDFASRLHIHSLFDICAASVPPPKF